MVEYHEHLKLGKGAAFVKSKLRNLPQTDDVWEADFQPIPEQVWKRLDSRRTLAGAGRQRARATSTSPTCCSKSRRRPSMISPGCWPMP